jgi:hypothetical protein
VGSIIELITKKIYTETAAARLWEVQVVVNNFIHYSMYVPAHQICIGSYIAWCAGHFGGNNVEQQLLPLILAEFLIIS